MDSIFDAYVDWLSRHFRLAAFGILALFIGLIAGVTGLSVTNDMRAYFSDDNPQLLAFERLERIFDRQDVLFFIVVAEDGDIFDRETLTLIYELTQGGWQAPHSRRVSSLANYQHTEALDDELIVTDLISSSDLLDDASIEKIRHIALSEPDLVGAAVAPSGSATAIQIRMSLPENKLDANDEVMAWVLDFLSPIRERHPHRRHGRGRRRFGACRCAGRKGTHFAQLRRHHRRPDPFSSAHLRHRGDLADDYACYQRNDGHLRVVRVHP